jgi:hypothetical protein
MTKETSQPEAPISRLQRRTLLKSKYFRMGRADELDAALNFSVEDYEAGVMTGDHFEGTGIAVIGESGSGKTKEINALLKRFGDKPDMMESGLERKFLQYALAGETTWKALGLQLLALLDYPLKANRTEHEIWSRVRFQMKARGIWLLHIDECQHMFQTLGSNESKKVINSIKTCMKDREWPILVVMSGIPELLEVVNLDPQLRNLVTPISLRCVDTGRDLADLDAAFVGYCSLVGGDVEGLREKHIYERMAHGHEYLFGRVFRFMVEALASLPDDQSTITVEHLADCYARKTGCIPGFNVFLQDDFFDCDVSNLMPSI